jgi:hypothetical protein
LNDRQNAFEQESGSHFIPIKTFVRQHHFGLLNRQRQEFSYAAIV